MFFFAKIRWHATRAFDAFFERHAGEVPLQVVAPGVVDTLKALDTARLLQSDQGATVRAAILEGIDFPIGVLDHDHGRLAHEGRAVASRLWQVDVQAHIIPGRAVEHALVLLARHSRVAVDVKWNPSQR